MAISRNRRGMLVGASAVVLAAMLLGTAAPAAAQTLVNAITVPSDDRVLSLVRPGLVAQVEVKDGDAVEQGQLLLALDDAVEQAAVAQLKAEAQSTVRIKAAEASLAQKREELRRHERGFEKGAVSDVELARARLDVVIGELSLELARFEQHVAQLKLKEAELALQRMRMVSPFSGRVEEIRPKVGEAVEELKPLVRVVQTDPLWVEAPVPTGQAMQLRLGDKADVYARAYGGEAVLGGTQGEKLGEGEVIFKASVADATSNTLRVRLRLANAQDLPAGQHVLVDFRAGLTASNP